jgi:hypothetical protein
MSVKERDIEVAFLHPSMFVPAKGALTLPAFLTPRMTRDASDRPEEDDLLLQETAEEQAAKRKASGGKAAAAAGTASARDHDKVVVAPEMLLMDTFWWLPSVAVYLALWLGLGLGQRSLFFYFVGPSVCIPLPILLFNVMFHPPDATPTNSGCYALDSMLDPLTVLIYIQHRNKTPTVCLSTIPQ